MDDKVRTRIIAVLFIAVFVGLSVRLVLLHMKPSESTLARIADGRHLKVETRGERGRILDRNGNILAVDVSARHVCVDPKLIMNHGDIQEVCDALTTHFSMDRDKVWKLLDQPTRQYVRIKKYMREKDTRELEALGLKGVMFDEVPIRNYPKGVLGAHLIGFANHDGVGSAGIEQEMNSTLQGHAGLRISQKDGRRREIYSLRTVNIEPKSGSDIYLTIDQQVQYFAEKALDELVAKHQPQGAWAIVQHVRTGEILAMASWPTYNLNQFAFAHKEWIRNRAIGYTYEPGSVMKAMVIASALDSGVVSAQDVFDCENGRWYYKGIALNDSHPEGLLSVADILKKSSNIGSAKIALNMGDAKVYQCLKDFGFGTATGLELPVEEGGILAKPKRWSKISSTRLAMGHEINVTSMQVVSAFSAIANGGVRVRPHVVKKIVDGNGKTVRETVVEELGRPIRPETAKQMCRLLARVTQPGGTGTKAALRGYVVAGKTGTAQKANVKGGGYYKKKFIASFAGFLPVENPEISIMVVADDPQNGYYGGSVCGPAFKTIADQTVRYLRISPQGNQANEEKPKTEAKE